MSPFAFRITCRELAAGDELLEPTGGVSTVLTTRYEKHPQGITVYNVRVAASHTYFVRADGSTAEPVWVHNANYSSSDFQVETIPSKVEAYIFGESLGRVFAEESLGLQDANWVNLPEYEPWNPLHDEFGRGFDDVLKDDAGLLWIVEYKGGDGGLAPGQMEAAWVRARIDELIDAGHPTASELDAAFNSGALRGVAIKTSWAPSVASAKVTAGATVILNQWSY